MPRKKSPYSRARDDMKSLGTYKPEFDPVIDLYNQLMEQYTNLYDRYKTSNYRFEEQTNQGSKKAPIVTTLEQLRKDILSYAAQLGLTPLGLLKANDQAFARVKSNKMTQAIKGVTGSGQKSNTK